MDKQRALTHLHVALGMKRLSRGWAKIEIVFGLSATAIGLMLGNHAALSPLLALGSLLLFVVGGYLALAGNRSLLYQSNNLLVAYLSEEMQFLNAHRSRSTDG